MRNGIERLPTPSAREMAVHAKSATRLLKAMANPHRLQILCVLAEGEQSVGALNRRIPLSQSALSQHLALLRDDGLVGTRRESQSIHYRVQPGPVLEVIKVLHGHFCRAGRSRRRKSSQTRGQS